MLELQEIHTYYGASYVLQGVSLQVNEGEAVALLGRNGVGKTTTIRSIIGFTPPRQGQILLRGVQLTRLPAATISRLGVGLVPQGRRIFPNLTVRENLTVAARNARNVGGISNPEGGWTLPKVYHYFPRLQERQKNMGNDLSGGEQQMLAIGRALMTNPQLLLMDEPSEGLAPLVVREIGGTIRQLKEAGLSILLVEQNLKLAFEICDRIYIMNKGRIIFKGSSSDLQADTTLMHQHLGV
ncbi:MAG: ABC transporter ATP-binding protein [Chloroflexota bacterium]